MIRWGAIAACLWAGAASAQTVPSASSLWGCGEERVAVAEVAVATREQSRDDSAATDSPDASGAEGRVVAKAVRFDLQTGGASIFGAVSDADLPVRFRAVLAQAGPLAADLQVEAEQSIAADPQV